jgi:Spy/CpxP family protein refolding chaperone
MARWLGLDDRQRAATEAVLSEMMPLILAQRDAVREARRRAADEYRQIQLDPERVQASVRHLNVAQARLDSLVAETMFREASLLTPEQRTRYFAAMPWERRLAGGGPHAGPRRP